MRKTISILFMLSSAFALSSCGYNTKNWPRITIPYEEKDINLISINYVKDEISEEFTITNRNTINYIYSNISFPFKKNIEDESVIKGYRIKYNIEFTKEQTNEKYYVTFYNFGISEGYVDLNGKELHFIPGDVESYYEKTMIKISEEE